MSWIRVDDGFTANSKIAQLTDAEFRCWFRLLCHCAKSHDPTVDSVARREVAGLTKQRVQRFADLEMLDGNGETYEIHDWVKYLPKDTPTERQARWRARTAQTGASTTASTETSTEPPPETSTEISTRAQVRADSSPVQSLTTNPSQSVNPLLDQPSEERPTDRHEPNGRSAEEQARIDAIDNWWKDEPATGVLERDPYSEPFNDLSPLGEQLAAAKAREEEA